MKKKKYIIVSAFVVLSTLASVIVMANGNGFASVTVSETMRLRDDAMVQLEGYIEQKLDHEVYLFRDETGRIKLEIEDDVWGYRKTNPDKKVLIQGEVERDGEDDVPCIEVERIKDL